MHSARIEKHIYAEAECKRKDQHEPIRGLEGKHEDEKHIEKRVEVTAELNVIQDQYLEQHQEKKAQNISCQVVNHGLWFLPVFFVRLSSGYLPLLHISGG